MIGTLAVGIGTLAVGFMEEVTPERELVNALEEHNYPAFYAGLRKLDKPLETDSAASVAAALIRCRCTARSFQALLDHVESREALIHYRFRDNTWLLEEPPGLLVLAAQYNAEVLDLMLNLGASPNREMERDLSPLEGAVQGGNRAGVRRLLKEPELNLDMTPKLRCLWAQSETNPSIRACWRLAGPLVVGMEMPSSGPVPLPEWLTLEEAVSAHSWDLVRRICRAQGQVSVKEALEILEHMMPLSLVGGPFPLDEVSRMLECLLPLCLLLLRRRRPQQLLLLCCLEQEEPPPALMNWMRRIPRGSLYLWGEGDGLTPRQWYGEDGLLARWRERLGSRPVPALDRNQRIPYNDVDFFIPGGLFIGPPEPNAGADELIRTCRVRGKRRPGELSQLAESVLSMCSPAAIMEQLEPGGLLAQEDPTFLMEFARDKCCRLEVCRTLAAYVKQREADPYRL